MIDEVREPAPEGTSFALLVLGLLSTLERFERSLAAPTAAPARGPATLEPSPAGDPALLAVLGVLGFAHRFREVLGGLEDDAARPPASSVAAATPSEPQGSWLR
jgi:hypothetical protein